MDLIQRQINIEQEYTAQGIALAIKKWETDIAEGRLSDTGIGKRMIVQTYGVVRDELDSICNAGTRGVGGRYRSLIKDIGVDMAAVIGVRATLGLVGGRATRRRAEPLAQDLLADIGTVAEVEHMLAKLRIAAPGYTNRVEDSLQDTRTRSVNHRRRTFMATADNVSVGSENVVWSASEKDGVSRLVMEALVRASIIELGHVPKRGGQQWVTVQPSDTILEHVERMGSTIRAFTMHPPMLVPPKPHTRENLFQGASYLTDGMNGHVGAVQLRTRRGDHKRWLRDNISDMVLSAANKAATQPYRIDTETASLLRDLYSQGVYNGIAGIPSVRPIEPPSYPLADGWDKEDPGLMEQHLAWKVMARQAYSDEITRKSKVVAFHQTLKYLREYAGDTLYFPTFFDWRGRLYFRSRINPQGTDFVKAVIQFANKKALGKRGLYWLKVHVATCFGYDKKLPDCRAVWVDDNMEQIRDAVARHIDSDFFREADSPWCFYVAAREMLRAIDSGDPESFETGVPVAMDATCSGMQHLSAVLRDPVGGMFTNLLPNKGDAKEDIYAGVAAIAIARLQADRDNPEQAQYWLQHGVPRSMAKRPVMTYVYGGTLMSCGDYVLLDMQERGLEALPEYSMPKLASYLGRNLRHGIELAVPSAAAAMRFLRSLAGMMPRDEAMRWVSPAGFPVIQHYAAEEVIRLDLPGIGAKVSVTRFDDAHLNRSRCVNGIAPNFVHSLDSGHLVRVLARYEGSLVPIHDSFATHPSDVDAMHMVLRDEFVDMYEEHDPLDVLVQAVQAHREEIIEQPEKGTLDIRKVRESVFFMC
jgi:DNA-directed RNA polymerase